jgi:hypothetical protein
MNMKSMLGCIYLWSLKILPLCCDLQFDDGREMCAIIIYCKNIDKMDCYEHLCKH